MRLRVRLPRPYEHVVNSTTVMGLLDDLSMPVEAFGLSTVQV
jgi:hypothetical protein